MQDQLAWWQYTDQVILDIDELSQGERYQFDSGLVRRYRLDEISAGWFETIKSSLNPISVEYVERLLSEHTGTDS